jgi:hypothetical protein
MRSIRNAPSGNQSPLGRANPIAASTSGGTVIEALKVY